MLDSIKKMGKDTKGILSDNISISACYLYLSPTHICSHAISFLKLLSATPSTDRFFRSDSRKAYISSLLQNISLYHQIDYTERQTD